jgi:hypothetical protein
MSRLDKLRSTSTKSGFADVLGVSAVFLTRCLYINKPENQYHQFTIDKKTGGKRVINSPSKDL